MTRVISLLGGALPKKVLGEGCGNEVGHWEPARLARLNEDMLRSVWSRWNDYRALGPAELAALRAKRFPAEISRILSEEYGDQRFIVLKDPRICRFAPLYIDILDALGYEVKFVHVTRNPMAVAASLEKRNAIPPAFSILIWLRHVLDAEAATRGRPRVFASYESLMDDSRAAAGRIKTQLGLIVREPDRADAAIESFLDKARQRHESDLDALLSNEWMPLWLKDAYVSLASLESNPEDPRALATIERARAAFEDAAAQNGLPILRRMKVFNILGFQLRRKIRFLADRAAKSTLGAGARDRRGDA